MTRLCIEAWAGVAPGLASRADWRAWAESPVPLRGEASPDVSFLPAMQRRRCDVLSRMMLSAVNACCDESERAGALTVFASRHGSFGTTVAMLEDLARDRPLSPTSFSHSVHNTQAGLFSIWSGNQQLAQSLASRNETFEHGFLEAVCLLARSGGRPVLLVVGDEALPEPVSALSQDPDPPYAIALLLRGEGGPGTAVEFDLSGERGSPAEPDLTWPKAAEFLRWWVREDGETLSLGQVPRVFQWRRAR